MYEWIIVFLKYFIAFFLLIAMLEGLLTLRGKPRIFIVRIGNRGSYLKEDGDETSSYADGVSFSFWNPKRYVYLRYVNRHVDKWEFRKLQPLITDIANSSKLKEKKRNDKV